MSRTPQTDIHQPCLRKYEINLEFSFGWYNSTKFKLEFINLIAIHKVWCQKWKTKMGQCEIYHMINSHYNKTISEIKT